MTRAGVLEAAIDVFGTHGFEGTSTRALAQRAGTNLTAIRYHFGSKEGLYLAAAERIASGVRQRLHGSLDRVRAIAGSPRATREELIDAIAAILDTIVSQVAGGAPDPWFKFIAREQLDPTHAFDVLFGAIEPVIEMLSMLIGRVLGRRARGQDVRLLTMMLTGQVSVFRSQRSAALRALGWSGFGAAETRNLRAAVRTNTVMLLNALADRNDRPRRSARGAASGGEAPAKRVRAHVC